MRARAFVITPYREGPDGRLEPDRPSMGPCGDGEAGACRLLFDHARERKTGPCFPLTVLRCRAHGRAFTLYPPGHVPYGRESIAPVGSDGQWLQSDPVDEPYAETSFDAALDACDGRPWARQAAGGTDRWWSTQGRRLKRLVRWLGLDPGASERQRQALSEVLVVALLLLVEQVKAIAGRPGYRSRGAATCSVLAALPRSEVAVDRLVAAGHIAGLWGQPYRCNDEARVLRALPYRSPGTRAPPSR